MARTARDKRLFSTYLIKQRCNTQLFANNCDELTFIEILKSVIKQYNCLIVACELTENSYRLIIYDNGNDISSIMRSINISVCLKAAQKIKFSERFKSTILDNCSQINDHLAKFNELDEQYKHLLVTANERVNSTDFRRRFFSCNSEFCNFINGQKHVLPCLDAECHRIINVDLKCLDINAAKTYLTNVLNDENMTLQTLRKNKKLRNRHILYLRKHSNLGLKQIGELFDISESAVSKIIKRAIVIRK